MSGRYSAPRPAGRLGAVTVDVLVCFLLGAPVLAALAGPLFAGSTAPGAAPFLPPGTGHPLGTDVLGRDVLALVLTGGRSVIGMTTAALLAAYAVGLPLGLYAAGTRRRWADEAVMRGLDLLLALPSLLLLMSLAAAGRSDRGSLVAAAALVQLPAVTRLVRAAALAPGCRTAVEAMRQQGVPRRHIEIRYVARCALGPLATDAGSRYALILYLLASANFLGLGLPSDASDWAVLIERNTDALFLQPVAVLVPAGLLTAVCVGANLGVDRLLGRSRGPASGPPRETVGTAGEQARGGSAEVAGEQASAAATGSPATTGSSARPPRGTPRDHHGAAAGSAAPALLRCRGLSARTTAGHVLLDRVDLDLAPGRTLALIGPSGSGKTTLGLAALALTRQGVELSGEARIEGADLLSLPEARRRRIRRGRVAHLPQDPASVLDPVRRVGGTLHELAALASSSDPSDDRRRRRGRGDRHRDVNAALHAAGLPQDTPLLRRYPHQLSGGQQQRMALATTLVSRPRLLVLDEPTSGLDADTAAVLTGRLRQVTAGGTALLLLTHDMRLVAELADDISVLEHGRIVETGPARTVLTGSNHPLLREYRRAPRGPADAAGPRTLAERGIEVRGLAVAGRGAACPRLQPVSLVLPPASRTALTGASGAGKTTLGRALAGLTPATGGVVLHRGRELPVALENRSREQLRAVQYVHQDSRASFDEFRDVLSQIADTAHHLRGRPRDEALAEAAALARKLGLDPGDLSRRPGALSGGQLQRASLARALAARPALLVCDEVASALDAVTARRVLAHVVRESDQHGTALLLITHAEDVVGPFVRRRLVLRHGLLHGDEPVPSGGAARVRPEDQAT
ncbi:ATP-binding cassette domain-containing protein [Streptomyces sp. TS71-3]|uniref:ABC transporter ATP-binding protein/permease n=1 Tax=Streptomyces sp. TS71-3 TaxID=2733862 RepID=UPI001B0BC0C3|nr:ATP-binding cassette domain-containing protein [Streptomyces sp. TS71-3]GHJ41271.1 hypothetical protein Sm713_68800 [Streptomyces sp. TS71-3]